MSWAAHDKDRIALQLEKIVDSVFENSLDISL